MTRLLIVDDSPLMRRLLDEIFQAAGEFEIVLARNGTEALEQLHAFRPDVVTLDVRMPGMDGLACLDRIMLERPTPVVMVSSLTEAGAETTLEAMALGAVDFAAKPGGAISLEIDRLAPLLVEKVRTAAKARLRRSHRLAERIRARIGGYLEPQDGAAVPTPLPDIPAAGEAPIEGLVVIGTSTGGPPALDMVLPGLPAGFPWPVLVAQHMPVNFTGPLARRLDGLCPLAVREVDRPMPLAVGVVYIARGDADLLVGRRGSELVLRPAPASKQHHWHPSVDRLVDSAVDHVGAKRVLGVLMTGMGDDGADAMARLRAQGGRTIAEAEETATVWGMPGALVKARGAEFVLPVEEIAQRIVELVVSR